ncbi:hypothetical protein ILYODFUR_022216 [Ilyodon furcidens]|uniref:Secreted protein n=1 Tax=Ilyodon furcidens TaxID=33524 RepID=A0ABV0TDN1_9TELE
MSCSQIFYVFIIRWPTFSEFMLWDILQFTVLKHVELGCADRDASRSTPSSHSCCKCAFAHCFPPHVHSFSGSLDEQVQVGCLFTSAVAKWKRERGRLEKRHHGPHQG